MNDQNIMFGYIPTMEKLDKSKNVNQLILMNFQNNICVSRSTVNILMMPSVSKHGY